MPDPSKPAPLSFLETTSLGGDDRWRANNRKLRPKSALPPEHRRVLLKSFLATMLWLAVIVAGTMVVAVLAPQGPEALDEGPPPPMSQDARPLMPAGAVTARPASLAGETTSMGAGSRIDCIAWTDARRTHELEYSLTNWALGYISGAAQHGSVGDPLARFDLHGVRRWLDRQCSVEPARSFVTTLDLFIAEHSLD